MDSPTRQGAKGQAGPVRWFLHSTLRSEGFDGHVIWTYYVWVGVNHRRTNMYRIASRSTQL